MKWLGYAWSVFTGLITLGIALAVITAFESRFERVVVDLLVLIYVAIRSGSSMYGFVVAEQAKIERDRFLILLAAVGDKRFENEDHKQGVKEEDAKIWSSSVKGYIQAGFIFIIFVLAVWNLVTAL